jgi:S1-C subfamily serine protease
MDEHNDERREEQTEPPSPRTEPETTGTWTAQPTPKPFGPEAPPALWSETSSTEPAPASPLSGDTPADSAPGGYSPGSYQSTVYGPGVFATGGYTPPSGPLGDPGQGTGPSESYGPGGYAPGDHASAASAPGSYLPPGYGPDGYPPGYGPPGQPTGPDRPKRSRKLAVVVAAALVLVGAGGGVGIAYGLRQNTGTAALATSPAGHSLTTAQIAAEVDPAVVDINTNLGEGTGMIATSNGEIITNNHVIEGVTTINVVIEKRGTYRATVVGTDAPADVAVLQIKGVSGLPTVKFANSSTVRIGNAVVAIGNAGGQGFPSTVTAGAVTALGRTITASDQSGVSESLTGMIQMDALIEPGNSGGPLVNSAGQVVGMNTAAASADGATPIGFALPVNRVLRIANDIEQAKAGQGIVIGAVAYLGVAGETVSLNQAGSATGAGLEYVEPSGPAGLAGIQEGDVIVSFDGHATATMSELATLIHKLRPGDRAKVTFANLNGGTQTVTVTLGSAPPA